MGQGTPGESGRIGCRGSSKSRPEAANAKLAQFSKSVVAGSKGEYLRDAGGSVVSRTVSPATGSTDPIKVYRYTGGAVLDGAGAVLQRSIGLPGGILSAETADLKLTKLDRR